jgi:putative ABC transport system permease protein
MKFFGLVLRNARRNKIRSFLTIGSLAVSLFLSIALVSFWSINGEVSKSTRGYNRIIAMSAQGFASEVPITRVNEIARLSGIEATTPFSWFGGKYNNEIMPFAQFGVDPETFFRIYDDLTIPPDQLKAWKAEKTGCVIGRKLAEDRKLKVGDSLPLQDGAYPFDLDLKICGIYDGESNRDLRAVYFNWSYLDEGIKKKLGAARGGNAGVVVARCLEQGKMASLCKQIDESYANSNTPTKTQTEEAFGNMFAEMAGDFVWIIVGIGLAVGVSILCVAANAMAMALRERTTEIAVLKAIGFTRPLIVGLILAESVLIAGLGGLVGAIGGKLFFDSFDLAKYSAGFLPFFYVPWSTALGGLTVALAVGVFSGLLPASSAARLSVVNGLRKVV